jgi:NAD(P)-dependent dehydrogenase (short-subunit alcohol dehydrogenase family)
MPSVLITGANRGIGLEFAIQYLRDGWSVHACCREPDKAFALKELSEHGPLFIHRMDVNNKDHINAIVTALDGAALNVLINNAGITDQYGLGLHEGEDDRDIRDYDFEFWEEALRVNLLAPARITGAFVDNLKGSEQPLVVMVGSGLSSITNTWVAGRYAYRTSKAALNMLMRSLGAWLEPMGIAIVTVNPGWTKTDLGGPNARNTVEVAVTGMRKVLDNLTLEKTGTYWDWEGNVLPW